MRMTLAQIVPNFEVLNTFLSAIGSDLNSKFDSSPNFSFLTKYKQLCYFSALMKSK